MFAKQTGKVYKQKRPSKLGVHATAITQRLVYA